MKKPANKFAVIVALVAIGLLGYRLYDSSQKKRVRNSLELGMSFDEIKNDFGVDYTELVPLAQAFSYPPVESEKKELAVYALELSQGEVELFFNSFTNLIEIKKLR